MLMYLAVPEWPLLVVEHMLFGVVILLGHAEVDEVDGTSRLHPWRADKEVPGLDVSVDVILLGGGSSHSSWTVSATFRVRDLHARHHHHAVPTLHLLTTGVVR